MTNKATMRNVFNLFQMFSTSRVYSPVLALNDDDAAFGNVIQFGRVLVFYPCRLFISKATGSPFAVQKGWLFPQTPRCPRWLLLAFAPKRAGRGCFKAPKTRTASVPRGEKEIQRERERERKREKEQMRKSKIKRKGPTPF